MQANLSHYALKAFLACCPRKLSGLISKTEDGRTGKLLMRILMAGHLFPSPARPTHGVFVLERALALARRAPTTALSLISYFPFFRPKPSCVYSENKQDLVILRAFYLALPTLLFSWRRHTVSAAFRRAIADLPRPDVIHTDWIYPDAHAIVKYALARNIPSVITVHGRNAFLPDPSKPPSALYEWPLLNCAKIIAVSNDLKRQILAIFPQIIPEKIAVIPNGVDPARFRPISRFEARKELGIPQNTRMVLNVARLAPEKAQDTLIKAASLCKTSGLQFYIVGDGPLRDLLQRRIARLNLQAKVILAGSSTHDRVPLWMAAADVFALPSTHEGSPVTIYEALACGAPVVASNVGGIPEILNNPKLGMLVPSGDPVSLAVALDNALSASWDRNLLSTRGQSFTWDAAAEQTLALYKSIAPP